MVKTKGGGGGRIRDFAVILENHAFWTKFYKGYPTFSFNCIFICKCCLFTLGMFYGINRGWPTFLVQGQNYLEKPLRRVIFALAAKSSKSLFRFSSRT
jgi:hypothetical protein